jgi:AraC-like DNA-binding protein
VRNPPALERPVQVTRVGFPAGTLVPAHAHESAHELLLVAGGEMLTEMEGRAYRSPVGTLMFHPAGVVHAERVGSREPCDLLFVAWRRDAGIAFLGYPRSAADPSGRMRMLFEWLLALDPSVPAQRETRIAALHALVAAFVGSSASPSDELVLTVREHVRARLAEPLRLDDLAERVGMSKYHFLRVFRAATGMTPIAYVRAMRVDAARALLTVSSLPLREIASQVGFADEFQLSRTFRQVTGQSPGSVRRPRIQQPASGG